LDASKLKEEEEDTIIIIVKYAKKLLMSSPNADQGASKITNIAKTRRT